MLSKEDNETICRVGPGTPMGEAMREIWVPALLSSELPEPDGDPLHVELLGENLVAFRDSNGNVGLLDEYCCHRGASLTIGRVENCGLRCIYHGWLFATDGTILETPNVPDPRVRQRHKAKAYPVREAGGIVWAYLGSAETPPPLPDFPWIEAPANMRLNAIQINACNYLQLLEGLLDSSHLSILHSSTIAGMEGLDLHNARVVRHTLFDAMPTIDSELTEFGLHYAAIRSIEDKTEIRIAAYIAPFWQSNPNGDIWLATVPMTDEKTAFYLIAWDGKQQYGTDPLRNQQLTATGFTQEILEAYGQTRSTFYGPNGITRANAFRQDREKMRNGHFTGVPGIGLDDSIVAISSGPLRDRTNQIISSADLAIAHLYACLLKTVKQGKPVGAGMSVANIRGVPATIEPGVNWRTLVPHHYSAAPQEELAPS